MGHFSRWWHYAARQVHGNHEYAAYYTAVFDTCFQWHCSMRDNISGPSTTGEDLIIALGRRKTPLIGASLCESLESEMGAPLIAVQVGAMEMARNDLVAVVASRLEGSTWDGTLRLYRLQRSSPAAAAAPHEAEGDDRCEDTQRAEEGFHLQR